MPRSTAAILPWCVCLLTAGCLAGGDQVVVYTALDGEFSQPVFDDFTAQTQISVAAKFDTESTKTVGLAQAILAERARPRCDVFWNNEILNTLRLEKEGLLTVYRPAVAEKYPAMFRSPQGTWHGFAARARILLVNTKLVAEDKRPRSILDLADAQWQGRAGMAKPLFGTTATHAVCLFAHWGDEKAKDFFREVKKNQVKILSGNKQVALAVAAGQIDFGVTDTDDAMEEIEKGSPVAIVYLDQGPDGLGTLFIPNTVALVAGAPHAEAAKRLIDYVLSPAVEAKLAAGPSAQIPLNPEVHAKVRVATPETIKAMPIDFSAAVDHWDTAARFLKDEFTAP
jgi:iron(III) transport system substrate-binding protein